MYFEVSHYIGDDSDCIITQPRSNLLRRGLIRDRNLLFVPGAREASVRKSHVPPLFFVLFLGTMKPFRIRLDIALQRPAGSAPPTYAYLAISSINYKQHCYTNKKMHQRVVLTVMFFWGGALIKIISMTSPSAWRRCRPPPHGALLHGSATGMAAAVGRHTSSVGQGWPC